MSAQHTPGHGSDSRAQQESDRTPSISYSSQPVSGIAGVKHRKENEIA